MSRSKVLLLLSVFLAMMCIRGSLGGRQTRRILVKGSSFSFKGETIFGDWYRMQIEASSDEEGVAKARLLSGVEDAEPDRRLFAQQKQPVRFSDARWYLSNSGQFGEQPVDPGTAAA